MTDPWAITVLTECAAYLMQWWCHSFLTAVIFLLLKHFESVLGHTEQARDPLSVGRKGEDRLGWAAASAFSSSLMPWAHASLLGAQLWLRCLREGPGCAKGCVVGAQTTYQTGNGSSVTHSNATRFFPFAFP